MARPMRLLRIQIAHGFHAEAKLDAAVLRHLSDGERVLTFFHEWEGDRQSAELFSQAANCHVERYDTGFRPSAFGRRSPLDRVGSLAMLARAVSHMLRTARKWDPDVVASSQQRWDSSVAAF